MVCQGAPRGTSSCTHPMILLKNVPACINPGARRAAEGTWDAGRVFSLFSNNHTAQLQMGSTPAPRSRVPPLFRLDSIQLPGGMLPRRRLCRSCQERGVSVPQSSERIWTWP